jgi:hypothetical protein
MLYMSKASNNSIARLIIRFIVLRASFAFFVSTNLLAADVPRALVGSE